MAMQRMDVGEESLHAGDDVAGPHGRDGVERMLRAGNPGVGDGRL